MAEIECASCHKTSKSGKIFRECNHCGRLLCSDHAPREGERCPICRSGYLHRVR